MSRAGFVAVGENGLAVGVTRGKGLDTPGSSVRQGRWYRAARARCPRSRAIMVKGNWALYEEDFWSINAILQTLMRSASARSTMLIDKTGQLINSIGEPPGFDVTSFSSLAAADFGANA